MIERIRKLQAKIKRETEIPNSYSFLPELYEYLELLEAIMLKGKIHPRYAKDEREKIAGGMGRIITENYEFSESKLGEDLLRIADEFVKYCI
jgi:hypothetical protein